MSYETRWRKICEDAECNMRFNSEIHRLVQEVDKELEANKKEIAELKQSMLLCSGPCHFPDSEEKLNQIKAEAVVEMLKADAVILWISRAEQEEQILNVINNYATKLLTKEDRGNEHKLS